MIVRVLTVKSVFAVWIAEGTKRVENRTWGQHVRGDIAIHAGAPVCKILCLVTVIEVIGVHEALRKYPEQETHIFGPKCWILGNVRLLELNKTVRGKLSLWRYEIPYQGGDHE